SHHAAQVAAFFFRAAGRSAWPIMSADLAYPINLSAEDAVIVISHRGTKRFPVRSIRAAREAGAFCLGLTAQGSQMSGPDQVIQTVATEESSTFTASYTGALLILAQLAAQLGARELGNALAALPEQAEDVLGRES